MTFQQIAAECFFAILLIAVIESTNTNNKEQTVLYKLYELTQKFKLMQNVRAQQDADEKCSRDFLLNFLF